MTDIPCDPTPVSKHSQTSSVLSFSLKGLLITGFMGLVASWIFWFPYLFPALSSKVGLTSFHHLKDFQAQLNALEDKVQHIQTTLPIKELAYKLTTLEQDIKKVSQAMAEQSHEKSSSVSSQATSTHYSSSYIGFMILKERFYSGEPFSDIISLVRKEFSNIPEALKRLKILEKESGQKRPSYEKIKQMYASLNIILEEKARDSQDSQEALDLDPKGWLETIEGHLKTWVRIRKKDPSQEKDEGKEPSELGKGYIRPEEEGIFLLKDLEAYVLTPDEKALIGYLRAFETGCQALKELETILLDKLKQDDHE